MESYVVSVIRDVLSGVRHVWCFLPRTVNTTLPYTTSSAANSAEEQPGTCCWSRQRNRTSQSWPTEALPSLLEDPQSFPTCSCLHRDGEYADHGMHRYTSSLHSQQIMRPLRTLAIETSASFHQRMYVFRILEVTCTISPIY